VTAMFGHHPWTVQELVNGIGSGAVRLPDIQRPFVWSNSKVRDLIDSMYRGYPVGELMFWENRDSNILERSVATQRHKTPLCRWLTASSG
jgi:uncharacterized protein with ParB-like and HNH nuclease domain